MKNIIYFSLAITLITVSTSWANTSTIEDFEITPNVAIEDNSPKAEVAKDTAVAIPVEKAILVTVASKPAVNAESIQKLLREHIPQFKSCYQNELDTTQNPEKLKGRLNIKFKIGTSGKIETSEVAALDFSSDQITGCVKNVLDGIKFPEANKSVSVNQPMNLSALRR